MIHIANDSENTVRADVLLAKANPQYSRAALAKLFNKDKVVRSGKPIKPGEKILPGGSFEVDLSELTKPVEPIDLPIIYEDENVVVIDKPTGVISHARGRYWDEPSVASFIRGRLTGLAGERAGIVHRLDRATSGVMICAKNSATLSMLQKQFSVRKVKKSYCAVISGTLTPKEAVIDIPIGRNPKKPQTFTVTTNGKNAVTNYKTKSTSNKYSLLELTPQTGRTHQLRVHLKHLKHPILGDELYKGGPADRLYLHAHSIEITLPGGERKVFISPLPNEFKTIML
jgi:23S rRNA pseudouridine1911/1915/1917 synthase